MVGGVGWGIWGLGWGVGWGDTVCVCDEGSVTYAISYVLIWCLDSWIAKDKDH